MKEGQKDGNDRRIIRATKEIHTKEIKRTVGKGKDFLNMSPANCLNIPLKAFSPEVKKMLVAGMVKGGKTGVDQKKRPKRTKRVKIKKKNKLVCTYFCKYRSGIVNSKSFVGKVLLRIKWKLELN